MKEWASADFERTQKLLMAPSLDEQLGADHGVRLLDEMLRNLDWSAWEAKYAKKGAGRPPIHPRLMAGCILYGLLKRIRSTRDLEEATRMRLDFRWLLNGLSVDHSTFSSFRIRFRDEIEGLFQQLNRLAADMRKATLEEILIDGTRVRADSDRHGARSAESLKRSLQKLEEKITERLDLMDASDEASPEAMPRDELKRELEKLEAKCVFR